MFGTVNDARDFVLLNNSDVDVEGEDEVNMDVNDGVERFFFSNFTFAMVEWPTGDLEVLGSEKEAEW